MPKQNHQGRRKPNAASEKGQRNSRLVPVLNQHDRRIQSVAIAAWMVALVYLWSWWLQPDHNINTVNFIVASLILAWVTLLPLYPLLIVIGGKRTEGRLSLPKNTRVAMIVTRAPSEPFHVVKKTLEAMLAQDVPHDTWLADEDPNPRTEAWCLKKGVKISTRRGVDEYHRDSWPRRTRCKEGNLAYFYDTVGYDGYDIVVQMDADHVPTKSYLREMLKPFSDPEVGYVSAPSICDANSKSSWSARSRLNVEGTLHGALQAGYNRGWAPMCIGSHYGVRTKALKEIGGLGPELAEDHSTTLMMNAGGWKGVHAVDAIAHGDGPETFTDLITQEFQWSRSIVTILLTYLPKHFAKLPPHLRFQFAFSELWYPTFAVFMALMYLLPIYALLTGERIVGIGFVDFILHALPASILLTMIVVSWQRKDWFRPLQAKTVSWEGILFLFARWPWVLAGSVAALRDRMTSDFVDFKITPKGEASREQIPNRVVGTYLLLGVGALLPALMLNDIGSASGFYMFTLLNAAIYFGLALVIVLRHEKESGQKLINSTLSWKACAASTVGICALFLASPVLDRLARGTEALVWDAKWFKLTETRYAVSGAGRHGSEKRKVHFKFSWGHEGRK